MAFRHDPDDIRLPIKLDNTAAGCLPGCHLARMSSIAAGGISQCATIIP